MRRVATVLGTLMVINGLFDFTFPWAAVRFFTVGPGADLPGPLPAAAEDISKISTGTRRYIALAELSVGALLLWLAADERR